MDRKLLDVLAKAVEAYRAVNYRGKKYIIEGYTAKNLVNKFPQYYSMRTDGKADFIGKTASTILEDYLKELGYEPGSLRSTRLTSVVIMLAKDIDDE